MEFILFVPREKYQPFIFEEYKKTFWILVLRKVARWNILKPKIQIWVNFGGPCNGRCWYILWTFGLFYSHLTYFMDI
jgi:hypothetical protein